MITVKDLMAELTKIHPDRIVMLASDSEGNSHAPLESCWTGATDGRAVGMERLTEKDRADGYSEDDLLPGGKPALILVPR